MLFCIVVCCCVWLRERVCLPSQPVRLRVPVSASVCVRALMKLLMRVLSCQFCVAVVFLVLALHSSPFPGVKYTRKSNKTLTSVAAWVCFGWGLCGLALGLGGLHTLSRSFGGPVPGLWALT